MLSVSLLSRKGFLIAGQFQALPKADEISMNQLIKSTLCAGMGPRPQQ
jgi:hypothetical protein